MDNESVVILEKILKELRQVSAVITAFAETTLSDEEFNEFERRYHNTLRLISDDED
ncbi:hypothetical protein [Campylobacter sp. 19-13652]|uniref:hypothetical protein n=1 Tax=Campylobacter sp. 19-13652 TaxID=2840180 RepID=UPI001C798F09|nr:hypothetical protein [Campylobacter sp. 19-13652]BCX79246.1 hypothetical protein LBC_07080 [Campylobacter sp. 19-13652]